MASAKLSRHVEKVVGYPPLCEMGELQRREFHGALLKAATFEDYLGPVLGQLSCSRKRVFSNLGTRPDWR